MTAHDHVPVDGLDALPVTSLKGVGCRVAERLARLDIRSAQDMLFHLPSRYQDRTRVVPIGSLRPGDEAVIVAEIGLAQLAVIQSRFEDAASHIQVVLGMPDAAGEHQTAHALWLWGLVQAERGDHEGGLASTGQALEMARGARITATEANCRRALGILHARAGDHLAAEKLLRDNKDKIPAELNTEAEEKVAAVKSALNGDDTEAIKKATEELNATMQKIGQAVYQAQQPPPGDEAPPPPPEGGEGGEGGNGVDDENTVEGEFKEV